MKTLYGTEQKYIYDLYPHSSPAHSSYQKHYTQCCKDVLPCYTHHVPTYRFQPNTCSFQRKHCPDSIASQHRTEHAFLLAPCTPSFKHMFCHYLATLAPTETDVYCSRGVCPYYAYTFGNNSLDTMYNDDEIFTHIPEPHLY